METAPVSHVLLMEEVRKKPHQTMHSHVSSSTQPILPTYQKQRRMWGKNASFMDGKGGVLHVLVHLKLSPGVHATSTS